VFERHGEAYRNVADPSRHGDTRNSHYRACTCQSAGPAASDMSDLQAMVRMRPTPYTTLRVMMQTKTVFS
jgi:hypothetical protein